MLMTKNISTDNDKVEVPAAEWALEQCAIYMKNPGLCTKKDVWQLLFTIQAMAQRHEIAIEQLEEADKLVAMYLTSRVLDTLIEYKFHAVIEDNSPPLTNEITWNIMRMLSEIFHIQHVIGNISRELCVMG